MIQNMIGQRTSLMMVWKGATSSPPRLCPSPTAITLPFLCMLPYSLPMLPFPGPLSYTAVFVLLTSASALPLGSSTNRTFPPSSSPSCPLLLSFSLPILPLPPHAPRSSSPLCPRFLFLPAPLHFLYSSCPPFNSYYHCFSCIPLRWPKEPTTICHLAAADRPSRPPSAPSAVTVIAVGAFCHFKCHSRYVLTSFLEPLYPLVSINPSASFDGLDTIWCIFLAPFFSCLPASHAPFDSRSRLRDIFLRLGELEAIVLRVQTGGAPDARKSGVEPSLSGPARGCITWCGYLKR